MNKLKKQQKKASRPASPFQHQQQKQHKQRISLDEAMRMAIAFHQDGQPKVAAQHYDAILQVMPDHPDALHYLGVARFQMGQRDDAIRLIGRALEIVPGYVDARNNLGNMQKESGHFAAAEQSYRHVIAARPDFALAHNNLGVVLKELGRLDDATAAYRQAVALAPEFVQGWINLGNVLKKVESYDEALTAYRTAILLQPDSVEAMRGLARSLVAFHREAEALQVYQQWQKLEPDNPYVAHHIAACSGAAAPQRASDAYVQQVFDRFAGSFDDVLAKLEYRAPALCGDLVERLLGAPPPQPQLPQQGLRVLDAGCGTGLCGPILRPYARRLEGVDLSAGMLTKAAVRGDYDALDEAELTAWLAARPATWDLIVSADTLCYFGALDQVLDAAAGALDTGGHLVFTVEQTPAAHDTQPARAPGFLLHGHGRYSHTEAYVRAMLDAAGLEVLRLDPVDLRKEAGVAVRGLLAGARKRG
jgi:predicted TPR repeat methyltransferase